MNFVVKFIFLTLCMTSILEAKVKVGVIFPEDDALKGANCVIQHSFDSSLIDLKIYNAKKETIDVIEKVDLAIKDKVEYIIGSRTSSQALTLLKKLGKESNTHVIIPIASHDDITKNYDYTIRLIPDITEGGKKMAEFISKKANAKEGLVIFKNLSAPYSKLYSKVVKETLNAKKIHVDEIEIINGQMNLGKIAQLLANDHLNFYLPLYSDDTIKIVKALSELDKNINIFTQGGVVGKIKDIQEIIQGNDKIAVYLNNVWSGKSEGPLKREFLKVAKQCKSRINDFKNLIAFDAVKILEAKIKNKSESYNMNFQGLLGLYEFNEHRNRITKLYIRKLTSRENKIYAE